MKSLLEDIYTDLSGLYNTEKKSIPNAIYMKIDKDVGEGSFEGVITMKYPLREGGVMGNDIAIGREEQPATRRAKVYRNNLRKVVSKPMYGVDKLDAEFIRLFEQHVDDLGKWNKEQEGLEIRQALLETFGETLRYGNTAAKCVPAWNPNIFVAGLGAHDPKQPKYDPNTATYTNRITYALSQAEGSTPDPKRMILNNVNLSNLSNYALRKRIEPLEIPGLPGGKGYVLTISELQAMYIGDPAWAAANLGNLYLQRTSLPEKVMNWPGVLGAYKNLLLVVDPRVPTVLRSGAGTNTDGAGSSTLVAGYMEHGDKDSRHRGLANAYDVAVLHGKCAIWKWEPEPLHNIEQLDDYAKVMGTGTACVRGIGIPVFHNDLANPSGGSDAEGRPYYEQFSSVIALCGLAGDLPAAA
jgi:hypothetical protein